MSPRASDDELCIRDLDDRTTHTMRERRLSCEVVDSKNRQTS